MKKTQGTNWMPQAVLKEAVSPGMKEQPYPTKYLPRSVLLDEPFAPQTYIIKIPHSIASCWMIMIAPR